MEGERTYQLSGTKNFLKINKKFCVGYF